MTPSERAVRGVRTLLTWAAVTSLPWSTPARAIAGVDSVKTKGFAYAIEIGDDLVTFCDEMGAHGLKLPSKTSAPSALSCAGRPQPYDPNSCATLTVSSPGGEANDLVEGGTWSTRTKGRVHACAENGGTFAVATGSAVVLIGSDGRKASIDARGAEDVWMNERWAVWVRANTLSFKKMK